MLNVYLMRHGETQWNVENNRYCSYTDIGLTDKGVKQAERSRDRLKDISFAAVYASNLQRAWRTAGIISGKEAVQDPRLQEVNYGQWEGKTRDEFDEQDKTSFDKWLLDPGTHRAGNTGETASEVVVRVDAFFIELLEKHKEGNVLVVAHNGTNRLFLCHRLDMPFKNYHRLWWENAAISLLTFDADGMIQVRKLNSD